ncbi:MAG: glycosyltransferase family 2 protein [Microbacterium sp.]|uniref:glycosyltransferase family A protein n=1 Tax=Microbacterium sp. TaxID=51671 RepID=UPI001AC6989E|nr:glycosyltransferase family A protein [Microbacterium sp.]MBN9178753.1 glycosyltransferase family 2 protein [Microbacterium sp.]
MGHRVAVVVRTKNRPEFLRRALADIAAQTYGDLEIIVVNDGGDHALVTRVIAESDVAENVTVCDTDHPSGRSAAANLGVSAAQTEFIALHDDDDLWHPDFLADGVAWLDAHPGYGGVSMTTEIVYEELRDGAWGEIERVPFWNGMTHISLGEMLVVNRIVPISFLYRRALHDEHGGYDVTLDAVEDWDFYLRVMCTHPIGYLAGPPRAFWTQRPSASGAAANSMFELASEHARDDAIVRDRALSRWIADNDLALPLYIGSVEKRLRHEFSVELASQLERQRHEIVGSMYDHHPLWRRLRKLRARFSRSRSTDGQ